MFDFIWVDANGEIVFHPHQKSSKNNPRLNKSELPCLIPFISGTITHKYGKVWVAPLKIKTD